MGCSPFTTYFTPLLLLIGALLLGGVTCKCPCFTEETLSSFTNQNTNATISCKNETYGIGLWMNRPSWWNESSNGWWHPYSFHAYKNSCLMEGDIMVPITTVEEAEICRSLIVARCKEMGLLP